MTKSSDLREKFRAKFGGEPRIYRAPGRVNLIGEYTDFNDGFVMPAAIGRYCWVAAEPRADRKLAIYSENVSATYEWDFGRAILCAPVRGAIIRLEWRRR